MSTLPHSANSPSSATGTAPQWADPQRGLAFQDWLDPLTQRFQLRPETLRNASADASFRRYFRIDTDSTLGSVIIMDAPPERENCPQYVKVANLMRQAGIRVPEILDWQEQHGFMLLSDLGGQTLMQSIQADAPPPLQAYLDAVDVLVRWQLASQPGVLPEFDAAFMRREMELLPQWYITQYRHVALNTAQQTTLSDAFECIIRENLNWPQVFMHRDFMPRNLMPSAQGLGVLDFQDAVFGPITYDIASLLRDAFLSWEEEFCLDVTIRYWEKARKAGLPVGDDFGHFYRGVEWMGLQRHLKIAGLFARITLRDGKPQYLADTPRFIGYIRATCRRYRELGPLARLIETIDGIDVPNAFAFGRV